MNHLLLFSSLILFSLFLIYPSFIPLVNAEEGGDTPVPTVTVEGEGDAAAAVAGEGEGDISLQDHAWWHTTRTTTTTPRTTTSTRRTTTTTSTSTRRTTTTTPCYACGDPAFLGFHSQPYQVHGQDNAIYNLISTALLQVNTQFHFIKEGESRNIQELRQKLIHEKKIKMITNTESKQHNHNHTNPLPPLTLAFSHPGQYMIGFAFKIRPFACISNRSLLTTECDDSNITYLEIAAGAYEDGLQLLLEQRLVSPSSPQIIRYPSNCKDYEFDNTDKDDHQCDLIIDYSSPYRVSLHFRWLSLIVENSDYFLNIPSISLNEKIIKKDIEIIRNSKRYAQHQKNNNDVNNYLPFMHGLLGCSYTVLPSEKLPYGAVDDYLEEEKNIFGDKFISNRF